MTAQGPPGRGLVERWPPGSFRATSDGRRNYEQRFGRWSGQPVAHSDRRGLRRSGAHWNRMRRDAGLRAGDRCYGLGPLPGSPRHSCSNGSSGNSGAGPSAWPGASAGTATGPPAWSWPPTGSPTRSSARPGASAGPPTGPSARSGTSTGTGGPGPDGGPGGRIFV